MNIVQTPALVHAFATQHIMLNPAFTANPHLQGMLAAGLVVAPGYIMRKLDEAKPGLLATGAVKENGEVDLAIARSVVDAYLSKAGKLTVKLPLLPELSFDSTDIDVLFRLAGDMSNGEQKLA